MVAAPLECGRHYDKGFGSSPPRSPALDTPETPRWIGAAEEHGPGGDGQEASRSCFYSSARLRSLACPWRGFRAGGPAPHGTRLSIRVARSAHLVFSSEKIRSAPRSTRREDRPCTRWSQFARAPHRIDQALHRNTFRPGRSTTRRPWTGGTPPAPGTAPPHPSRVPGAASAGRSDVCENLGSCSVLLMGCWIVVSIRSWWRSGRSRRRGGPGRAGNDGKGWMTARPGHSEQLTRAPRRRRRAVPGPRRN